MMIHAEQIQINEFILYYPTLDPHNNISAQIINYLKTELVPEDVQLIQTVPGQAFFSQVYVAALVGITIGIPVLVREASMFLRPALKNNERNIIRNIAIPAVALFIIGCVFSYFLVIPYTLEFLYKYGEPMELVTFLVVTSFIGIIIQFLIAFGLSFQLPLFMYAISSTGMVDSGYWLRNARISIVIIVVFGAMITPDGSGVTMWFIALPMIALYFVGVAAVRRSESGASV